MQTEIMRLEPNVSDVTEVDMLEDTLISLPVNYEDSHAYDTHLNHLSQPWGSCLMRVNNQRHVLR